MLFPALLFFPFMVSGSHTNNPGDSAKYITGIKIHYGFVMSHHKNIRHLTTGHFPAFEICFAKQTRGEKPWHQLYKYPLTGISFWCADFANPKMLGSAAAVFPYMNFPLAGKNRTSLNFRFGAGLGYLSKKFDRIDNYKNIAIGSHLNVCVNMGYELRWKPFKNIVFSGALGITHFSNGAFKTPNLGINIPALNFGIAYSPAFAAPRNLIIKEPLPLAIKKPEIQAILSGGMKELYPAYGDKYGAFSFSANYLMPFGQKRKTGPGIDFFWEFSNIRTLKRKDIAVNHDYEVIRPGIHIGHQLEFSHLYFITEAGYYLYAKDKSDGMLYSRLALRYRLNSSLLLNLSLKTHFAKADFVEWGIGYVIQSKRKAKQQW